MCDVVRMGKVMVDISKLPIHQEIKQILNAKKKPKATYRAIVSTPEKDIAITLKNLDINRDYGNHIGEHIEITFQLPLGDYHRELFPYRDNLECILIKETDTGNYAKRYKLIVKNADIGPEGGFSNISDKEKLNTLGLVVLECTLLDVYVEVTRGKIIKGLFQAVTMKEVMSVTIARELSKIMVNDRPYFDRIDIIEPANMKKVPYVIIRDGLYLIDLPNYLQEKYGVYRGDIAVFFQTYDNKHTCFIYPPYDYRQFDIRFNVRKLIVNVVPNPLFDILDTSYTVDGNIVKIITGESTYMVHDGERDYMDKGNAILQSDSRPYMKKPVVVEKDGPKGAYERLNYRIANKDRRDGVNISQYMDIGKNTYVSFSKVMRRSGVIISVDWQNADIDLLYPGMPVMYQYSVGRNVRRLKGVLHKVMYFTHNDMIPKARLYLFVEKR